jgi:hypothetical protein
MTAAAHDAAVEGCALGVAEHDNLVPVLLGEVLPVTQDLEEEGGWGVRASLEEKAKGKDKVEH